MYAVIGKLAQRSVLYVVESEAYGSEKWAPIRIRKPHFCILCGWECGTGATMYVPLSNRGHRICSSCISKTQRAIR